MSAIWFFWELTAGVRCCRFDHFYKAWKGMVDVEITLRHWGFPKSSKLSALEAAVDLEMARRDKEFKEVCALVFLSLLLRSPPCVVLFLPHQAVELMTLYRSSHREGHAALVMEESAASKRIQRQIRYEWYQKLNSNAANAKEEEAAMAQYSEALHTIAVCVLWLAFILTICLNELFAAGQNAHRKSS